MSCLFFFGGVLGVCFVFGGGCYAFVLEFALRFGFGSGLVCVYVSSFF